LARGKVLVVDDEPDIVDVVRTYLEREGYEVFSADDGQKALESLERLVPDVLVLDVMLPYVDGLEVCQQVRKTRSIPILMLSARDDDVDKILGLEMGADDYLTKPFNPRELVARVRAMFRRLKLAPAVAEEETIIRHNLKINVPWQRAEVEGKMVPLTPLEFSLLKVLAANPGHVLSRQELLNRVWGADFFGDERTVDTHIQHLRAKLQKAGPGPQYITSVWGVGYKFEA
jgi:DNA-binding response OmpR family regulator